MLFISRERQSDISAVRKVNERAFKGPMEARLVDLLREANKATISLVAKFDNRVVGHILFSPITIESNPKNMRGLGLAPLAVLPEYQRRGIGSTLVTKGLEECRKKRFEIVVVLGDVRYYARFGFKPARLYGLSNEYNADENFMVLELKEGALNSVSGLVKYQPEFEEAEAWLKSNVWVRGMEL
ncbi:MAG: N-acetyltransferase [Candidatus Bathyarchaeia archaeon]